MNVLEVRPGFLLFEVTGKDADRAFRHEAGGHRWQRVPPTEKRGRVHTSTVTVAVLAQPTERELVLRDEDLEYKTCRGSGAGGQHRNTTDSAVQLRHLPSGLYVRIESERSQLQNKNTALNVLRARLLDSQERDGHASRNSSRKGQIGVGARGDKRRTIALQRDSVVDHVTGKSTSAKLYLRGFLEDLW